MSTLATSDAMANGVARNSSSVKLLARSSCTFCATLEMLSIFWYPGVPMAPTNSPITFHPCDLANSAMFAQHVVSIDSPFVIMMRTCDIHATAAPPYSVYTLCSKKHVTTSSMISPFTTIFGTRITKSIGHRQVFLFSHLTYFVYLLYLGKLARPKYQ